MTRPPNPKSAKVRKIKVWTWAGAEILLRSHGQVIAYRKAPPALLRYAMVRATLLLPAKAKGKA